MEQDVAGSLIQVPFSHRLPIHLAVHPHYDSQIARIAEHIAGKYPDSPIIDVGGNIGDTVAMLRSKVAALILSVEGDAGFYGILQDNSLRFTGVTTVHVFLGDSTGDITATLVKLDHGTATIQNGRGTIHTRTLDDLLVAFPQFKQTKFLKIDADGFDNRILLGSEQLLSSARPVLFFEYAPHEVFGGNPLDVFSYLERLGYSGVIVYDNFGRMLVSSRVTDNQISELTRYINRPDAPFFFDLAVFHQMDDWLFAKVLESEVSHFSSEAD